MRLVLLGDPISHSRSPAIQRAALDAVGIDGTYEPRAASTLPEWRSPLMRFDTAASMVRTSRCRTNTWRSNSPTAWEKPPSDPEPSTRS